jgi:phosphoribosylformylglycinamidine synthase
VVHLNQLRRGERRWQDYQMLVLPGGFSYAECRSAPASCWRSNCNMIFAGPIAEFVASGKPVIGICNGFQALVNRGCCPTRL